MRIKETIERDCCVPHKDFVLIGDKRDRYECKHCGKEWRREWCGPGNNDYGYRQFKMPKQ